MCKPPEVQEGVRTCQQGPKEDPELSKPLSEQKESQRLIPLNFWKLLPSMPVCCALRMWKEQGDSALKEENKEGGKQGCYEQQDD